MKNIFKRPVLFLLVFTLLQGITENFRQSVSAKDFFDYLRKPEDTIEVDESETTLGKDFFDRYIEENGTRNFQVFEDDEEYTAGIPHDIDKINYINEIEREFELNKENPKYVKYSWSKLSSDLAIKFLSLMENYEKEQVFGYYVGYSETRNAFCFLFLNKEPKKKNKVYIKSIRAGDVWFSNLFEYDLTKVYDGGLEVDFKGKSYQVCEIPGFYKFTRESLEALKGIPVVVEYTVKYQKKPKIDSEDEKYYLLTQTDGESAMQYIGPNREKVYKEVIKRLNRQDKKKNDKKKQGKKVKKGKKGKKGKK